MSKIQWTEKTWNPWHGCRKISTGCKYCYMYRDKERYGQDPTTVLRSKSTFDNPLKWTDGKLIFTCSWSDWFIEDADAWRQDAWEVIRNSPQHTFQILTKRPERIHENLPEWFDAIADRTWIGVSVENQDHIDRLKYLSDLPCLTFASFEPLLGAIKWNKGMSALDWCIIGGESGNEAGEWKYRPCKLEWIEGLCSDAIRNDIPVFVKQLGTYQAKLLGLKNRHGGDIFEFPPAVRRREFPSGL